MSSTERVLNTFFNPFTDDIVAPVGSSESKKALIHALGLGTGYGISAYALRRLVLSLQAAKKSARDKELAKSYVNAAMPVISANIPGEPGLTPEQAESIGTSKTAADNKLFGTDIAPIPSGRWLLRTDIDPAHVALSVAAALTAGIAGARLANASEREEHVESLDSELKRKKREHAKLLASEYARTRGLPEKTASEYIDIHELLAGIEADPIKLFKEAGLDYSAVNNAVKYPSLTSPQGWAAGLGKAYWIWAALALALGYAGTKSYMDDKDPARARQKELEEIKRRMAMQDDKQQLLTVSDLPDVPETATEIPAKKTRSVRIEAPVRRPELEARKPVVVDANDPYAALLKGV